MTLVTRWIKTTTHLFSILSMIFLTMGAVGLRHTSWPVLRLALQREEESTWGGGTFGGRGGSIGTVGGDDEDSNGSATYMTSVWSQWGPGVVTFTLWMFLRWIPCKVCRHWQRSSLTTGAPAGRTEWVRGCPHGYPPTPVRPRGIPGAGSHLLRAGRRPPGAGAASLRGGAGGRRRSRLGPWVSARRVCVCGCGKAGGSAGWAGSVAPRTEWTPFILIRRELLAPGSGKFPVRKEGGPARLTRSQRTEVSSLYPNPHATVSLPPPRWGSSPDGGCASQATLVAGQGEGKALGTLGRDPHRVGEVVLESSFSLLQTGGIKEK